MTTDVKDGTVVVPSKDESVLDKYLRSETSMDTDGPGGGYEAIIRQVLAAESPDAVLTPVEAEQARDYVGINLLLHGYELNQSDFDAGSPWYASLQVEHPDSGERKVLNCGHRKVMAQLVKLRQFDQWPYKVMIMERGRSAQGTPMLELRKWVELDAPPF